MSGRLLVLFFYLIFLELSFGGVAPNPFLRPGSGKTKPPPAVPAPPPPPPISQEVVKEVEFRGFFLLKGVPHFCIFNKKANFGEWIRLSEKTHESFLAESFDLESETLTLAFNGQSFQLTLEQSKGGNSVNGGSAKSSVPKLPAPTTKTSASTPKVMPPKPRSTPQLPDWLVQRSQKSGISNSSTPGSRGSNSFQSSSGAVLPGVIPPRRPQSLTSPSPRANSGSLPGVPSSVSPVSQVSTPVSTSSSVGGASFNQGTNSGVTSSISNPVSSQGDEIDLSTLPPPPPPPNILPPSGPPDIIPSRDE